MKRTYLLLMIVFLINLSMFAQAQLQGNYWVVKYPQAFNSTYLINDNVGWAVGEQGIIVKSTDGGTNWSYLASGTDKGLKSVFFVNENIGWVVGNGGLILKTTDGGSSWVIQNSNSNSVLNSVYFFNSTTGIIVGNSGKILKTTNAGENWETKTINTDENLMSVSFSGDKNGFLVGAKGTFAASRDWGDSWGAIKAPTTKDLNSVFFDGERGCAVGASGAIIAFKSFVNNIRFEDYSIKRGTTLMSVTFKKNIGWAVGEKGTILKSTNYGTDWKKEVNTISIALRAVFFINENTGYIVGDRQTIFGRKKFTPIN